MDRSGAWVVGRLANEPKFEGEENPEKQRVTFTVAWNRGFGDNRKSNFMDCIVWGKRANFMRDFEKGFGIHVVGDLEQDTYTTKDGNKRSRVQINVHNITATTSLRRKDENSDRPTTVASNSGEEVTIGGVEDGDGIPF